MKQRHLLRIGQGLALLFALAVISSPELRAFVFVADYIGLEMLVLLGGLYFRSHFPALQFVAGTVLRRLLQVGALVVQATLRGASFIQLVGPASLSGAVLLCSATAWRSAFSRFYARVTVACATAF